MSPRFTLLSAAALLAACSSTPGPIFNSFSTDKGGSVSIDAKQRVVFSGNRNPPGTDPWRVTCAEPSPDALSAISASASIDAATLGKSLGLALSSQEGAASIGLRTQTITILRDAMYRLCEGYASGALDEIGFNRLQRRYQNIMLGLLAIEQITGAVVANQATIGGTASAKLGGSLAQLSVAVQEARTRSLTAAASKDATKKVLEVAQQDEATKKTAYEKEVETAKGDQTVKAVVDAKKAYDGAVTTTAKAKKDADEAALTAQKESDELASLEAVRKELDRAAVLASTSAAFSTPATRTPSTTDLASVQALTTAVSGIVNSLVARDYTRETCLDTLMSRTMSVLSSKSGNSDALELALRYCAFALEADGLKVTTTGQPQAAEAARAAAAVTASRLAFTASIDNIFTARRAAAAAAAASAAASTPQK